MKKRFIKVFIVILLISLGLIYMINSHSSKYDKSIDLKGGNGFWQSSLNINLRYDSELIIRPARDDFKIPSEINVDMLVNNKRVYTDRLKYIPDSNKNFIGKYMVVLNSADYFKENTNDVYITIRFNNENSSLLLKRQIEAE